MRALTFWQPMRRRLSLLISVLLLTTVGAFSWLAYHQLASALIAAASARLGSTATRLAEALSQSDARLRVDKRRLATDSTALSFLESPGTQTRLSARAAIDRELAANEQIIAEELWTANGQRLIAAARAAYHDGQFGTAPVRHAFASGSLMGPFVARGDTAFSEIRVPIVSAAGDTLGVVREFQRLSDRQGPLVRQLIGADAMVFVGNDSGSLWTDLSRRVAPPDALHRTDWVASSATVPRARWIVWVALPRATVLAPARSLLKTTGIIALAVLGIGCFGASLIGRHLTRPIGEVTAAAEQIAAGDYSGRVSLHRRDEIGRLATAFNAMTTQVEATTLNLQQQAVELEVANQELGEALAERTSALVAARASEARFRAVVEAATDAIFTSDASGRIVFWNAGAREIYGHSSAEAVGSPVSILIPEEGRTTALSEFVEIADGRKTSLPGGVMTRDAVRKDGSVFPVELTVSRWEADGEVFITSVVRDVSSRAALEARLAHQASHDALTGLANRSRFRDRVLTALDRPAEERDRVAVLFLDLDDFKAVNDTAGHAAGDQLLTVIAERLLSATRGSDTVARLGGDEFGVLLPQVDRTEDVDMIAARIIAALRRPVLLGDHEIGVGASIGVARGGADLDADGLLQNADTALYAAKDAGKGTYAWFAPEMHHALLERAQIQGDLGPAVDRAEFWLAFQPIVALDAGRVQGVEALVRWNHPKRGVLLPGEFIAIAEASGQVGRIGRWVLKEACRQVAQFPGTPYVTVNISGRQLEDPALVADVAVALAASGLAPERLYLEITETVLMADTKGTLERLSALKALGVRVAIDDFGTGYSSLRYLQRFPVDVLKIDKSFVDRIDSDDHDAALVRTIVALSEMLGLTTVAEGIERIAQREHLRALGCRLGQGYHFTRPLDAPAMISYLETEALIHPTPSGAPREPRDREARMPTPRTAAKVRA